MNEKESQNASEITSPARIVDQVPDPMWLLFACAAFGGLVAALGDLVQKEEASAVVKLTSLSARHVGVVMKPYCILFSLVFLASFLCIVFQPSNRKQAFLLGTGIIALIMTMTPYKQPPAGGTSLAESRDVSRLDTSQNLFFVVASEVGAGANIEENRAQVQIDNESVSRSILFKVENNSDYEHTIAVSLFNEESEEEYYQKNLFPAHQMHEISFTIPLGKGGDFVMFSVTVSGMNFPIRRRAIEELNEVTIMLSNSEYALSNGVQIDKIFVSPQSPATKFPRSIIEKLTKGFAW